MKTKLRKINGFFSSLLLLLHIIHTENEVKRSVHSNPKGMKLNKLSGDERRENVQYLNRFGDVSLELNYFFEDSINEDV